MIMKSNNPSVNFVDSSLYTREPFYKCWLKSVGFAARFFDRTFLLLLHLKNMICELKSIKGYRQIVKSVGFIKEGISPILCKLQNDNII